ncbi:hypothetical protein [Chryseobacterium indologenes]|uniref:Uncharacterized protein n=1 Tax=Chryseobacterium indologenes TaxID=253 RepID=A0A0N0ZT05_CHRID|nr:hypothetical protein [Chryseobacterium indologenes]KPE49748.1 hypothetical protein AOB46_18645 [Chryseobacterium indologenes]
MKNFSDFQKKYPETAAALLEMTKEQILEHYVQEVSDKEELSNFKREYENFQTDLKSIGNSAKRWLINNRKNKHHLFISTEEIKLIYSNVETEWI